MDPFQREIVALLPRLRRFARAIAGDATDADDLVQVAVERALVRRAQYQPGTRLEAWVYRIMKNAWIDEARARSRRSRRAAPAEAAESLPDPVAPGLEARREADAVQAAMADLPEEQRLAVALVLIEGLSYREAADALEVPIGTLTSRLVRGRMALQARLEGRAT